MCQYAVTYGLCLIWPYQYASPQYRRRAHARRGWKYTPQLHTIIRVYLVVVAARGQKHVLWREINVLRDKQSHRAQLYNMRCNTIMKFPTVSG